MLCAFVNEKLLVHSAAKTVLRKHALYGYFYHLVRTAGYEALSALGLLTAWVAREGHVFLVLHLVAGKYNLTAVDYYYVISTVEVRCVIRLVLAAEYVGNLRSHAAKRLVGSIYYIPVALYDFLVRRLSLKAEVSHVYVLKYAGV
jgi:hypothetical protein